MNRSAAKNEFTEKFHDFVNRYPKSIFLGNRGGNLYTNQNAICYQQYVNVEYLSTYSCLKERIAKTASIDSVFNMIVTGGYQFYVYEELSYSFEVCTLEFSREKFGEYVSHQATEYKKKTKALSTDATKAKALSSDATVETIATVHFHPKSKDDIFTDEVDEFKDIPDRFKRYVHSVVSKYHSDQLSSKRTSEISNTDTLLKRNNCDSTDSEIVSNELILSARCKRSLDEIDPTIVEKDRSLSPERNIIDDLFDESTADENHIDLTKELDEQKETSSIQNKTLFEFPFYIPELILGRIWSICDLASEISFPFYQKNRLPGLESLDSKTILRLYDNKHIPSTEITETDSKKLLDFSGPKTAWLNDNLIGFFMSWSLRFHENDKDNQKWKVFGCPFWLWEKIRDRDSDYIARYFHPLLNIFNYDVLLIQINWKDTHWTFATVLNHSRLQINIMPEILYFDSTKPNPIQFLDVQKSLFWFLNHECVYWYNNRNTNPNANKMTSSLSSFTDKNFQFHVVSDCHKQKNDYDCGMFVCHFIHVVLEALTKIEKENTDSNVSLETYLTFSETLQDEILNLRGDFFQLCEKLSDAYFDFGSCDVIQQVGFRNRQQALSYAHAAFHIMFTMDRMISIIVTICDYISTSNAKTRDHLSFLRAFLAVYITSFEIHKNYPRVLKKASKSTESSRESIRTSEHSSNSHKKLKTTENFFDLSTPTKDNQVQIDSDLALTYFLKEKEKYSLIVLKNDDSLDFSKGTNLNDFLQDCLCLLQSAIRSMVDIVLIYEINGIEECFGVPTSTTTEKCLGCRKPSYKTDLCRICEVSIAKECSAKECGTLDLLSMRFVNEHLLDDYKCRYCDQVFEDMIYWKIKPEYLLIAVNRYDINDEKNDCIFHPDPVMNLEKYRLHGTKYGKYYLVAMVSQGAFENSYKVTCVRSLNISRTLRAVKDWEWVSLENDIVTSCGCFQQGDKHMNCINPDVMSDKTFCLLLYSLDGPQGVHAEDTNFPFPTDLKEYYSTLESFLNS